MKVQIGDSDSTLLESSGLSEVQGFMLDADTLVCGSVEYFLDAFMAELNMQAV